MLPCGKWDYGPCSHLSMSNDISSVLEGCEPDFQWVHAAWSVLKSPGLPEIKADSKSFFFSYVCMVLANKNRIFCFLVSELIMFLLLLSQNVLVNSSVFINMYSNLNSRFKLNIVTICFSIDVFKTRTLIFIRKNVTFLSLKLEMKSWRSGLFFRAHVPVK